MHKHISIYNGVLILTDIYIYILYSHKKNIIFRFGFQDARACFLSSTGQLDAIVNNKILPKCVLHYMVSFV